MPVGTSYYKDWEITYNPKPIPDIRHDYDVTHLDYDGPEDDRHFTASTYEEAINLIDEYIDDHGE